MLRYIIEICFLVFVVPKINSIETSLIIKSIKIVITLIHFPSFK